MSGLFFTEVNMQVIIHNEVANTLVKYELTNSFSKFTNNNDLKQNYEQVLKDWLSLQMLERSL